MKPYRWFAVVLLLTMFATVPVVADDEKPRSAGADIVRMWNARLSADTILLFVRQSDLVFTSDDLAVMAEAGLPDRFIRDLLKTAGSRPDRDAYPLYYHRRYDPYYYGGYPWWFYGGHVALDVHLGGHFGGHHYGSIGHHYGSIGHHYGSIGHGSRSHGFGHRGGHVSHGGGHHSGGHGHH